MSQRHQVVHQIVATRYGIKNIPDQADFLFGWNVFVAEVGGIFVIHLLKFMASQSSQGLWLYNYPRGYRE